MKKICILSAVNIKHMSLISLYTDILEEQNFEFDIIYMDKYGKAEEFPAKNMYVFKNIIDSSKPKIIKALQYLKFRRFAIPILEKNKYDFVIVWNDVAIIMFADYLARKWRGKYCLNVRDYCYQKESKFIYNRFKRVIENSAFTTISSDGFKSFLPKYNYFQIHSLNLSVLQNSPMRTSLRDSTQPIRISFIGNVRFFELNQKLLDLFKNDNRFQLCYFGTNANRLKEYATKNNIINVDFHDAFPVKDTAKYLEKTDLINNLYGNDSIALKYALSIKLYHGIYLRIPVLVNSDTWGEQLAKEYKIGYVMDSLDNNFKDDLYNWYTSFNFNEFDEGCRTYLKKASLDNSIFKDEFIKNIK